MARTDTLMTEAVEELQKAILRCCITGDVSQLRQWLRRGVPVVLSGTPLIQAAAHGMLEVVRFLVKEAGANVNQAMDNGCTAVFIAAQHRHVAVLRYLVKKCRADVNQAVNNGATPLLIAAEVGHTAVLQCLVKEFGADVNQARTNGSTPLMTASAQSSSFTSSDRHGGGPIERNRRHFGRADCVLKGAHPLRQPWLRWCRAQEVRGLLEGLLLWARVHSGALAGAQGGVQAVGR
jgi:hypothetical protein